MHPLHTNTALLYRRRPTIIVPSSIKATKPIAMFISDAPQNNDKETARPTVCSDTSTFWKILKSAIVQRIQYKLCPYSSTRHSSVSHLLTPVADIPTRSPPATATSFFHGRSGDSETVRSLSLLPVPGIAYLRNWNSCGRQHSSVILRHFCSTQHTSPTNYGMRHRANCRRRTTNPAITVTILMVTEIKKTPDTAVMTRTVTAANSSTETDSAQDV